MLLQKQNTVKYKLKKTQLENIGLKIYDHETTFLVKLHQTLYYNYKWKRERTTLDSVLNISYSISTFSIASFLS